MKQRYLVIREKGGPVVEIFVKNATSADDAIAKVAALPGANQDRSKYQAFPFTGLHDGWSY